MFKWKLWAALLHITLPVALYAQHNHVEIAQQNMPAVVTVNVLQKDGSTFSGTGFVVTENGVIATARHVLDNTIYTQIAFPNGATSGEAILLAQQPQADVALLKIEARYLPTVTLAMDDTVQPGQTITVIGNPRRLQNTVTSGLISQIRTRPDGTVWHQISAPISPRSSGSPVFNDKGEVIGMATASIQGEGNQNLNFAVPVREIKNLLTQEGISLPTPATPVTEENPFIRHIKKSWEITKRLFHKWKQQMLANPPSNR